MSQFKKRKIGRYQLYYKVSMECIPHHRVSHYNVYCDKFEFNYLLLHTKIDSQRQPKFRSIYFKNKLPIQ